MGVYRLYTLPWHGNITLITPIKSPRWCATVSTYACLRFCAPWTPQNLDRRIRELSRCSCRLIREVQYRLPALPQLAVKVTSSKDTRALPLESIPCRLRRSLSNQLDHRGMGLCHRAKVGDTQIPRAKQENLSEGVQSDRQWGGMREASRLKFGAD